MKHQYKQDVSDYRAAVSFASARALRGSPWRHAFLGFRVFIMLATALTMLCFMSFYREYYCQDLRYLNLGIGLLVLMCGVFLFMPYVFASIVARNVFGSDGLYSDLHTVEITDTHIAISVRSNTYSYSFADILGIESDSQNIYAVLDKGVALYIPQRSFQSTEERDAFVQALNGA